MQHPAVLYSRPWFQRSFEVSNYLANKTFDLVEIECILFTHAEKGLKVWFKVGLNSE